jgi:hypothetical protein
MPRWRDDINEPIIKNKTLPVEPNFEKHAIWNLKFLGGGGLRCNINYNKPCFVKVDMTQRNEKYSH